jgi:hypothetical protein
MATRRSAAKKAATRRGGAEESVTEVRERARRRGITGASRMRKDELVAALGNSGGRGSSLRPARKATPRKSTAKKTAAKKTAARKSTARKAASPRRRTGSSRGPGSRPSTKRTSARSGQGEDYRGQTLVTRDHDVIRSWAEARGAVPATVEGQDAGRIRVLRLDFPGYGGDRLQPVSWDDWFAAFDARDLDVVYQEHTRDGAPSNFFRLVREDT